MILQDIRSLGASSCKSACVAAKHGVTVNAICPGHVRAPLAERQIPDTGRARGTTEQQVIRDLLLAALAVDGGWAAH